MKKVKVSATPAKTPHTSWSPDSSVEQQSEVIDEACANILERQSHGK